MNLFLFVSHLSIVVAGSGGRVSGTQDSSYLGIVKNAAVKEVREHEAAMVLDVIFCKFFP